MKTETEEVILYEDDKAAQLVTVTGWKNREGRFFGKDENGARLTGCTHYKCDCGNVSKKPYTKCKECRDKAADENFNKMPFVEWDGVTPLVEYNNDKYFFSEDDIFDYLEDLDDDEIKSEDLRLVVCVPNKIRLIDFDYWGDEMPENVDDISDINDELVKKVNELNAWITTQKPLSWQQGKYRTTVKLNLD